MSRSSRRCLRRRQAHYAQKMGDLLCFGNLTDFFPIRIDFGWYGMWLMTGTVSSSSSVLSVIISNGSNVSPNFGFFWRKFLWAKFWDFFIKKKPLNSKKLWWYKDIRTISQFRFRLHCHFITIHHVCSSVTKEWHHKPATESKYNECKLVHIANGWVYMNEESLACTLQQLHVFFTIFFCRKNPKDSNIFQ